MVGDYAEERLRAALYDAWLAKPIEILVNASVNIVLRRVRYLDNVGPVRTGVAMAADIDDKG